MSWADDEGFDAYDEPNYPDGHDNMGVWVDVHWNQTPIHQLETTHIKNIIRGLEAGKSYFGQISKIEILKKELKMRSQQ